MEHARYYRLSKEGLPEKGAEYGEECDLDKDKYQKLRGAEATFKTGSVFKKVVRVHEPGNGRRAKEACRRDRAPELKPVRGADGV